MLAVFIVLMAAEFVAGMVAGALALALELL